MVNERWQYWGLLLLLTLVLAWVLFRAVAA
jgi:hypothetical protein